MVSRTATISPWLGIIGAAALLGGLAWDALLHAADPTLAMREGIFTLSNLSHVLLLSGIVLIAGSAVVFLLGRLRQANSTGRRWVSAVSLSALLLLAGAAGAAAIVSAGSLSAHPHSPGIEESGHAEDSSHGTPHAHK